MADPQYHEPLDLLSEDTKNLHRGILSLIEELEAVDWYSQRADACSDPELKEILIHNRDEEIEHAMMALEWIRRRSPEFDQEARTYLFANGPITAAEEAATAGETPAEDESPGAGPDSGGSLGIGRIDRS